MYYTTFILYIFIKLIHIKREGDKLSNKNIIGANIRFYRKEKKYTQKDLIARLGIHGIDLDEPKLSRIETQQRPILDYEVLAFSKALNIPIEYLFKK